MKKHGMALQTGEESESEYKQSAVGKAVCEAKTMFAGNNIDQLVAQAIMSSFTHKNRHRDQNSLVPTVGLSLLEDSLTVTVYDCHLDTLFTSDQVQWMDMDLKQLSVPGVVLLWLLMHHHKFLRGLSDHAETLPRAQLHTIFTNAHALQAYELLKSYSICRWPLVHWKKQLATARCVSGASS